jgi:hypothetical protein
MASTQLRASLFHGFSDHSHLPSWSSSSTAPAGSATPSGRPALAEPNVSAHPVPRQATFALFGWGTLIG